MGVTGDSSVAAVSRRLARRQALGFHSCSKAKLAEVRHWGSGPGAAARLLGTLILLELGPLIFRVFQCCSIQLHQEISRASWIGLLVGDDKIRRQKFALKRDADHKRLQARGAFKILPLA